MNRGALLGIVASAMLAGACTVGTGAASFDSTVSLAPIPIETPIATMATVSLPPDIQLPVDPSIVAVSKSNPSTEAAAAMSACYVDFFGVDAVSGMGLVPHARDIGKYIPVRGPELATDDPAWAITFKGKLTLPRDLGWTVDPACVVVDGQRYFYIIGEHGKGSIVTPPHPFADLLTMTLPALAP